MCSMATNIVHVQQRATCRPLEFVAENESRCLSDTLRSLTFSSHGSGTTTKLLELPTEVRLELYETISRPGHSHFPQNDELDIARFTTFDTVPYHEHISRKSYSWILCHRSIFEEAIAIICGTHPIIFYSLDDIQKCRDLIQAAKNIILDVEKVPLNPIRQALRRLRHLPNLERLEIRASPSNIRHVRIPPQLAGYPALVSAKVVDMRLRREEQRHANQYALEAKMLKEQVQRLDEELQIRESRTCFTEPENFHVAVGDLNRLHLWSTTELYLTKHDLQLKMLWCSLRNSPEAYSGSPERGTALHCQNALLERDLMLRRQTKKDKAEMDVHLSEEYCLDCGHKHE